MWFVPTISVVTYGTRWYWYVVSWYIFILGNMCINFRVLVCPVITRVHSDTVPGTDTRHLRYLGVESRISVQHPP